MSKCDICGNSDLYTEVAGMGKRYKSCSVCTVNFVGGLPLTAERLKEIRDGLGLADGEYLEVDYGAEAKRILGR